MRKCDISRAMCYVSYLYFFLSSHIGPLFLALEKKGKVTKDDSFLLLHILEEECYINRRNIWCQIITKMQIRVIGNFKELI
jgi:hypothetical protein